MEKTVAGLQTKVSKAICQASGSSRSAATDLHRRIILVPKITGQNGLDWVSGTTKTGKATSNFNNGMEIEVSIKPSISNWFPFATETFKSIPKKEISQRGG
ncbi:hypothetical protein DPMN_012296 [Dreissena polymorpha]|uniref:Uncharacterized protein n=1 Tax=Dreissena polymorpha TaxID=45954 RepID=A0A9D4N6P4_DREPO|nr:hypothetical protein DPMN_012296 [Dreissena polymorpha]